MGFLAALGVVAAAVMLLTPPITHAPASHPFADQRRMLGIPNLLVMSLFTIVIDGLVQ